MAELAARRGAWPWHSLARQQIVTENAGGGSGFFRLKSDRENVSIQSISVTEENVKLGISID